MNLSFKEWLIAEVKKKQLPVHQNMKQWVKSVESLEKELETLKSIFKNKKINIEKDKEKINIEKDKDTKKINVIDKKIDVAKDKKPQNKDVIKKINVIDKKIDVAKDKKPQNKDKKEISQNSKVTSHKDKEPINKDQNIKEKKIK